MKRFVIFAVCFAGVLAGAILLLYLVVRPWAYLNTTPLKDSGFPTIDETLPSDVKSLLEQAKSEYENQQPGTYYADGVSEPWCADFISFLYKEIGQPLENPNTGSWRIPGIYTLQEYLASIGAWHGEPDYQPAPGDIAIYNGGLFGAHTNLVVEVGEDYIITIGGNENNKIRLDKFDWHDGKYGLWGFGRVLAH